MEAEKAKWSIPRHSFDGKGKCWERSIIIRRHSVWSRFCYSCHFCLGHHCGSHVLNTRGQSGIMEVNSHCLTWFFSDSCQIKLHFISANLDADYTLLLLLFVFVFYHWGFTSQTSCGLHIIAFVICLCVLSLRVHFTNILRTTHYCFCYLSLCSIIEGSLHKHPEDYTLLLLLFVFVFYHWGFTSQTSWGLHIIAFVICLWVLSLRVHFTNILRTTHYCFCYLSLCSIIEGSLHKHPEDYTLLLLLFVFVFYHWGFTSQTSCGLHIIAFVICLCVLSLRVHFTNILRTTHYCFCYLSLCSIIEGSLHKHPADYTLLLVICPISSQVGWRRPAHAQPSKLRHTKVRLAINNTLIHYIYKSE